MTPRNAETPRARVLRAVAHREGPVPIYMWYHGALLARLARRAGCAPDCADVELLGNDIVMTWLNINREMARPLAAGEVFTDVWGVGWERAGLYNQVVRHPLAGADEAALDAYRFPTLADGDFAAPLDALLRRYGATHYVGADISGCVFEPCCHLRGMSNLLMDLATGSPAALRLLDRATDFVIGLAHLALDRPVDWIWPLYRGARCRLARMISWTAGVVAVSQQLTCGKGGRNGEKVSGCRSVGVRDNDE